MNWRAVGLSGALSAAVLAGGCSARTVELPLATAVTPPAPAPRPPEPGRSEQLAALVTRDVAGLPPTSASADASLLPAAIAALRAQVPAATAMERISVYDNGVYFTWADPTVPGRAQSGAYDATDGLRLFEDAELSSDESYPLDAVDPAAPAALVAGIEARFPSVHVTSIDLRRSLSYGFDLAWYLSVQDAAGGLATVFADLDGTVIAVDDNS